MISFYISTTSLTWWVSLLVDQRVPEGTCSQVLRSTSVDSKRFESINIFRVEIYWNCKFCGLFTIPFGLSLFWHFCDTCISFQLFSYFVWLRINDDGSVLEMRIWFILLSLFSYCKKPGLYTQYLVRFLQNICPNHIFRKKLEDA